MNRVLITGGGGFVGQWLVRELLARGATVWIAGLEHGADAPAILSADERASVNWLVADTRSLADVDAAVEAAQPDTVVHLAAIAFPPSADREPLVTYDVNCLGVVRIIDAIERRRRAGALDPLLLVIGSSVQYGRHEDYDQPLSESAEQRPIGVYAASKSAQEIFALQAARATGLRVICTRSFNHSGPGHAAGYLLPSLVARALTIRAGGQPVLRLGNDSVRDYLHVADVAAAYAALCEHGRPGEAYNVASGVGVTVRELAADVLLRAGIHADISTDPILARATDIPMLVGSPAKLTHDTGWRPRRTSADIIDDLLRSANAATN